MREQNRAVTPAGEAGRDVGRTTTPAFVRAGAAGLGCYVAHAGAATALGGFLRSWTGHRMRPLTVSRFGARRQV